MEGVDDDISLLCSNTHLFKTERECRKKLIDIETRLAKAKSEKNVQLVDKLQEAYKVLKRTTDALVDAQSETSQYVSSSDSLDGESETLVQASSSSVEPKSYTYEEKSSSDPFTETAESQRSSTQGEKIIQGKIIETKIFANDPSQTYVVDEAIPVKQSQLSQDQTQPVVEKEKSDK